VKYWIAILGVSFSIFLMLMASGCVAFGAVAHKVMGPPWIPAKYVPPPEASVVVLVEDYHRSSAYTDDEQISRFVEEQMKGHLKSPVVDSSKVRELRLSKADQFKTMTVAEVGRQVGAQQVIWVNVVERNIESLLGGEQLRGDVSARVRVIDSKSGQTLWPMDMAEGYPLSSGVNFGSGTPTSEADMKQTLYHALGDKIAKLFYKWQPENEEPEGFTVQ